MSDFEYDDPAVLERWVTGARTQIQEYLSLEGLPHGQVGDWPAWHVVPVVSIWAIESVRSPGSIGWWVIYGDLPTDYISARGIVNPRTAMAAFSQRWTDYIAAFRQGNLPPGFVIGDGSEALLGPLESRAATLDRWVNDDECWDD